MTTILEISAETKRIADLLTDNLSLTSDAAGSKTFKVDHKAVDAKILPEHLTAEQVSQVYDHTANVLAATRWVAGQQHLTQDKPDGTVTVEFKSHGCKFSANSIASKSFRNPGTGESVVKYGVGAASADVVVFDGKDSPVTTVNSILKDAFAKKLGELSN